MPTTVSNTQLAARVRRQNREGSQKRREKQKAAGNVQLGGLWIPQSTKVRLETLARDADMTLSEVITIAIHRLEAVDVDDTAHLLASPNNAARLRAAVADHRTGGDMVEIPTRAD